MRSGTADKPITLTNYADDSTWSSTLARSPSGRTFIIQQADYWTLHGLEIMGARHQAYVCELLCNTTPSSDCPFTTTGRPASRCGARARSTTARWTATSSATTTQGAVDADGLTIKYG